MGCGAGATGKYAGTIHVAPAEKAHEKTLLQADLFAEDISPKSPPSTRVRNRSHEVSVTKDIVAIPQSACRERMGKNLGVDVAQKGQGAHIKVISSDSSFENAGGNGDMGDNLGVAAEDGDALPPPSPYTPGVQRMGVDPFLQQFFVGGEHDFGNFSIAGTIFPYSSFIARLYNLVRSFGFRKDHIMPSRAFCSDESQGAALMLLTKHFGIFPFNHGLVGGIVAVEWHAPHAHHGDDLVIVSASHVGYNPEAGEWGMYRRVRCRDHGAVGGCSSFSPTCGAMHATVEKYAKEFRYAQANIFIDHRDEETHIFIDNDLLQLRPEALLRLRLDQLLEPGNVTQHSIANAVGWSVISTLSTRVEFLACQSLHKRLKNEGWQLGCKSPIGSFLREDFFHFSGPANPGQLEANLLPHMPTIVCSPMPMLVAAIFNTQREFDRTYRSIIRADCYQGRDLFFISGLNIDISPSEGNRRLPILNFIPWAALLLRKDGTHTIFEQEDLVKMLMSVSSRNRDEINLESSCTDDHVTTNFVVPDGKSIRKLKRVDSMKTESADMDANHDGSTSPIID